MLIEQPEAFKTWLTAVLKPMCDADPAALAKYVLALIKKDKSEEELQKIMIGQLEVFLENETESFVNLVMQTLKTQDYITTPVIPNANPPNPVAVTTTQAPPPPPSQPQPLPPSSGATIASNTTMTTTPSTLDGDKMKDVAVKPIVHPHDLPNLTETLNGATRKDGDKREKRGGRHRSRTRSRSRSWERTKSRGDPHRTKTTSGMSSGARQWRNKSPPRRFGSSRRSRTPTPTRRSRSRSPPARHHRRGGGYRNRTPPPPLPPRASRSPGGDKRTQSRADTPTQDSNHGDMDMRLTNSTQSIQSVIVGAAPAAKRRCRDFDEKGYCMKGEMCPFDHGIDPVVLEDAALSTVLTTYNPNGGTPMDVTGGGAVAAAPLLGAPPTALMGAPPRSIGGAPEYNPQAPQMWNRGGYRGGGGGGPRTMVMGSRGPRLNFSTSTNHLQQRELVPVPVVDTSDTYNFHHHPQPPHHHHHHPHHHQSQSGGNISITPTAISQSSNETGGGATGNNDTVMKKSKQNFDFNRLGPRTKNNQNCSLKLKKIPLGLNSITHLNNHFSKFGKTVNIQVNYDGDPEAAIVTFSSHAEANAAYRSTEAVLNNRFIKVFWHNLLEDGTVGGVKNENTNNTISTPSVARPVKERLGIVAPNANKVLNLVARDNDNDTTMPSGAINPNTVNAVKDKTQALAAIKKSQELLAAKEKLKKNQDEQRKEVLKIRIDLRKRKQELLDKQLAQQKILIEKMEKLGPGPQRDLIMETIKKAQETIEAIKKDLTVTALKVAPVGRGKMLAMADVQRELLDAELDLITKQQEGADTSELQKKLTDLKAKAAQASRGRVIRGVLRGRFQPQRHLLSKINLDTKVVASGKNKQKHTIDHRPTRLLVSGYETEEQDSVLNHFQQYGEIIDYEIDATLPSITLNYKTRKEAEMALLKGKHFQDRTLSITWSSTTNSNNNSGVGTTVGNNAQKNVKKLLNNETSDEEQRLMEQSGEIDEEMAGVELNEEVLLQDDEEDDEENEDRSWRR